VTVLAGGVGAARFLRGLCRLLEAERLTVVVNTGDDENFFGLHVSPDLDTITYTLAGVAHRRRGWGVSADSFHCLRALGRFYSGTWFRLGDRDLATHIFRTDQLRQGRTLTEVTEQIAARFGVRQRILPMSDDPVRTFVRTDRHGWLPFQAYLVRERARGRVTAIELRGVETARCAPGVLEAIEAADAVVLPPSNPLVSIGPILELPEVRPLLCRRRERVAAISPIVAGQPVKGPAHRMLAGLGHEVSPVGVARLYADFVSVFVVDTRDATCARAIAALGPRPVMANTIMTSAARSEALAARVLEELQA